MSKNSKIMNLSLSIALAGFLFSGFISSCGGGSGSDQTGDSLKTGDEETQISDIGSAKKYEIKSGIVYYKPIEIMKGSKSQEILYFDDYGRREAKITTTELNMMGISNKEKSVTITDGDYSISFSLEKIENGKDVNEKVARKMKISTNLAQLGIAAAMTADIKRLTEEFDYREEGTEVIAGVTGKKISMALNKEKKNERIYAVTYKNILLKSEMMGIKIEAEKVEENVSVPANIFSIPEGYKVEEVNMDDLMKDLN
jgi:outer membrane lipoprotein-sorting protein